MRAAVLSARGADRLDVRDDVELRAAPGPGEVRIRVRATGVCHSDLSAMDGGMPLKVPALLGHEVAGVVSETGPGVGHVAPGDHVIVAAIPPCGRCPNCLRGQASMCVSFRTTFWPHAHHRIGDQDVFAFCNVGSFAEEIMVPADGAIPVAADVPFDIACIVGCAVVTGIGAVVNEARVEPGSTVLVLGCGGVGMSTILGARLAGAAVVVAVDLSAEKRRIACELGATHSVYPESLAELGAELHGGEGFDYAFEAIGLPRTIRLAYDSIRRGGTALVLGIGKPDATVEFSAYELAWSGKRLVGSTYGSGDPRRDFPRILDLWRAGRLDLERLITSTRPLDDINASLTAARAGDGIRHVISFAPDS